MTVYLATLDKRAVQAIPSDERTLFFGLAHLANEIKAFQKLYLWSVQGPTREAAEADGEAALSLMLAKLLAGKLYEGYRLLCKSYFDTPVFDAYQPSLNNEAKDAIAAIQDYFIEQDNVILYFPLT